jgi:hypothetical protein
MRVMQEATVRDEKNKREICESSRVGMRIIKRSGRSNYLRYKKQMRKLNASLGERKSNRKGYVKLTERYAKSNRAMCKVTKI